MTLDWDWPTAAAQFRRALELNPNSATSHEKYAFYLVRTGHMPEALAEIHRAIAAVLEGAGARHVAMESSIYVQNFQTAQILGAARGAAMAAAALQGLPVFDYAPLRVKQAVVGAGRASKEQMARTVMALLGHGRTLAADEADAAGVALCHAFTWRDPA